MRVRPYVLAGGRSSRMGRDKAMLKLRGRTLLGRVVDTLRAVPSLRDDAGKVVVTVVGERTELEGADRAIADRFPGCGPLGGMEAALRDLPGDGDVDWAFFVPVDMPFLPAELIDALLREWTGAAFRGAKVCYPEVDGKAQPLVSVIHKSLHVAVGEALTSRQFKVTPVLQSSSGVMAYTNAGSIGYGHSALHITSASLEGSAPAVAGWTATKEQERLKRLWFSNLNCEEDFRDAETSASLSGSSL